jgi:ethanolamine utilization protein EutP (predicted NTPase)
VAVAFDTLTYARRLREVGVPQEQAEALAAAVTETLATKQDLRELATKEDVAATRRDVAAVKQELHELGVSLRQELRELAATTNQNMRELELQLTVRLGGMIGVSVAAVAALVRLI